MNLYIQNMSKQRIKTNSDGTLKRVHTEVSGLSSSDDESTKSEKKDKSYFNHLANVSHY